MATFCERTPPRVNSPDRESKTIFIAHRGGAGDPGNRELLTKHADFSSLGGSRLPDHYEYRDEWANRLETFMHMLQPEQGSQRHFELDLMTSSDGDVMVVHNSDIDGQHVSTLTTEQLEDKGCMRIEKLINAMTTYQKDEKAAGRETRVTLFLELKGSLSSEFETDIGQDGVTPESAELVDKVTTLLKDTITNPENEEVWSYKQLPLIGFNHEMLKLAQTQMAEKDENEKLQIGLSYGKEHWDLSEEQMVAGVNTRADFQTVFIERMVSEAKEARAFALNVDERLVTDTLVEAAHAAVPPIKVNTWRNKNLPTEPTLTIEELARLDIEMAKKNVDGVYSDTPITSQRMWERELARSGKSANTL